jgi:PIN domain nuclease of toxin-antitoxin system
LDEHRAEGYTPLGKSVIPSLTTWCTVKRFVATLQRRRWKRRHFALEERLGDEAHAILVNGKEELYLSAATPWEVSVKMRLGKPNLPGPPSQVVPAYMARQGLRPLSVTHVHAVKVYDLPLHHPDPFDRIIIAQAVVEEMTVLTSDRVFEKYPIDVVWCGD